MNLIQILKKRNQILEGIKNSIFKTEHVEEIAGQRMHICIACPSQLFSLSGGCVVPGSEPCCNEEKGGCGCSLKWKTRALSDACPKGHWPAVLTEVEEALLNENLGLSDEH